MSELKNRGDHFVILNRAPRSRPGWIHIVPKGEMENKASGITQIIDDPAINSIWNRLQSAKADPNWPGLYAGREHFIYEEDQDSEALGWLKNFDKDKDGIWANEDGLTDLGQKAIANKHYKFTSMVINREDMEHIEGKKYRPLAIDTVGFTNMANGRHLLAPISNRENFAGELPADKQNNQTKRTKMKLVLTELGLSADASEESALAAVVKLKNRITTLEPFEAEVPKLKNRVADLDKQNVDSLLAARGIKDEKVMNRLKPVLAKMETVDERTAFLDDCGFKVQETKPATTQQTKLFNRDTKPPGGDKNGTEEGPTKEEKERDAKVMNRAREIQKETKNVSLPTAIRMAQQELATA